MTFAVQNRAMAVCSVVRALSFLCSQAELELDVDSEVFHGVSWIINEALNQLEPIDDAAKGGAR